MEKRRTLKEIGSAALYRENLYYIKQYPALIEILKQKDDTFAAQPDTLGIRPKGTVSRPTEREAIQRIMTEELQALTVKEIKHRVHIIETSLYQVPVEYRKGVFEHIVYGAPYVTRSYFLSHLNTWKKWTNHYVYTVAAARGQAPLIAAYQTEEV